jgi:putative spermidine/putrescine transport system substrate-binding protein
MKRTLNALSGLAFSLALGGVPAHAQAGSQVTLRLASFAGPFGDAVQKYAIDLFTMQTGVKVVVSYANPEDFLSQMIASRGRQAPYDVVCFDDDVTAQAIGAGVLQKLDPKIVTNLKYMYPEAKNADGYGPAMFFYSFGIAYNKAKLAENHIPVPTSWNELWSAALANHVSIPDIANIQGRDFVIETARLNGGNEGSVGSAISKIGEIKAQSYYVASSTLQAQLASGDVWAAPWNNMRADAMEDRDLPIGYSVPKEGGIGNTDTVNLAAGSQHPKEAQMLINYMIAPFAQLGMSELLPTGPSNRLLAAVVDANPKLTQQAPATPEQRKSLYLPNWTIFNGHMQEANDLWDRMKSH